MQIIVNILITTSITMLIAVGFSLIFALTHFFHFAHGVIFTICAYFAFLFKVWLDIPFFLSVPLAVLFSSLLGCLTEVLIYRPLRRRNGSSLMLLIASLGIYIVLQNMISMIFGDDTKILRSGVVKEGISVFGARITLIQILTICVSSALVIAVTVLLRRTKMGKVIRAVANDPQLASVSGIESNKVILWTFAMGSALAGVAGVFVALDIGMIPTMGMNALMMSIVAVIIGGIRSIPGVILGALLLNTAQHLGVWTIGSQWQDTTAFFILLVFLLLRPQGFLGKKPKKATI